LGDLIDLVAYRKRKDVREAVYGSYTAWVTSRFLHRAYRGTSRYDLAVEAQREGEFYLFSYFFPDFDW
jgi:hypothetical protein